MKPKDIVTINSTGRTFLQGGGFPAPVGALYMNILNNTAIVLEVVEDTAWVKMIKKSYPYDEKRSNQFGLSRRYLKVI